MCPQTFSAFYDLGFLSGSVVGKKFINCLSGNPYYGKPLKGNKKGCYSLRVGEYRIIYEVYPSKKIVYIIRIGHRKDIYR